MKRFQHFAVVFCDIFHIIFPLSFAFREWWLLKDFCEKRKKEQFLIFFYIPDVCGHIYLYKHLWWRVAVLLANLVGTKPFNLQEEKETLYRNWIQCPINKRQRGDLTSGIAFVSNLVTLSGIPASAKKCIGTVHLRNRYMYYLFLPQKSETENCNTVNRWGLIPLKYINALTWQLI